MFQQIVTLQDLIKVKEEKLEIQPTSRNRVELSKAEADLKKYLVIEKEYLKQKAGMK